MRLLLLALAAATTLSSCGDLKRKFGRLEEGSSQVTFRLAGPHEPGAVVYPLYGGVLLVVRADGNNGYGATAWLDNETQSVTLTVPNGQYHAGAIGWEGNSNMPCTPGSTCAPATGQSKCGIAYSDNTFTVSGGNTTVPITMSAGICQTGYSGNSTPFSDVAYNPVGDPAFPTIKFQLSGWYYTSTNYGGVWLNTYEMNNGVKTRKSRILLGCSSYLGGAMTTTLRLPVGKTGDNIFWYTLGLSASDSTCQTYTDSVEFENGLVGAPTSRTNGVYPTYSIGYSGNMNTITLGP